MRNIRLTLAYDGTDFSGWQRQPDRPTIQGLLESELETLLGEKVSLIASGRTDAGVHAANQVANFKTISAIPPANVMKALNDRLPVSVRIKESREAPLSFHARYDVVTKTYRYRILLSPVASPFMARFAYHLPFQLDIKAMGQAAEHFKGKHDFTSFAAAATKCHDENTFLRSKRLNKKMGSHREIYRSILVRRREVPVLTYEVRGNGFLHHMVRNIVGTLIEVGRGAMEPSDIPRLLAARDRTLAGPTAPAHGLCLWKVEY